tara:strand:- start:67 stop:675 length:609 start_codon:yes stop_codon:yes gene_type:complete
MEQKQDKLIVCPCCGSDACYESEFTTKDGNLKTWLCMTCGFTTNTTMTEDSDALKQTLELTAELIKDLRQDHQGLAWFPTAITMPEKGMIFPEPQTWGKRETDTETGETKETEYQDWGWTVVKAVDIPEEEQSKYPDPRNPGTFYKKRMDMKGKKRFLKLEFMDAAEELGMFEKWETSTKKYGPQIGSGGEYNDPNPSSSTK